MRVDLRIEEPDEPDTLEFSGFPLDYGSAMMCYRAYRDHGVLPFEGGSLDQPRWFWNMVSLLDRMYYVRWWANKDEAEMKAKAQHG